MKTVRTSEELGKAIKAQEEFIYIEGDLKRKIVRLKATGKIAWGIAGASIASAVALYLATPAVTVATAPAAGVGGAISFTGSATAATAAITILGVKATWVAVSVAVAAGGYGAIRSLRDGYSIISKDEKGLMLKRK